MLTHILALWLGGVLAHLPAVWDSEYSWLQRAGFTAGWPLYVIATAAIDVRERLSR